ncbi:hypothetical protein [Amycolatopsis samaneae]|uniref:S1 motif domain-containing protein n=1 Tax=Amycolatopsis samaneae TaxID=664691 RepID=A0ABW5GDT0_9PSEU
MDELELARHRFPDGAEVTGRVSSIPRPGVIGLFVDLPYGMVGFADVVNLPFSEAEWPPVGTITTFEVLQHRLGQVRLFPLDPRFRRSDAPPLGMSAAEWDAHKITYPVGSVVEGEVGVVYPANREYGVRYGDAWAWFGWSEEPPAVGEIAEYRVVRHLDTTRRTLLEPARETGGSAAPPS